MPTDKKTDFILHLLSFLINKHISFQPSTRSGKIDSKVIDGHVISGHALFTAPTPNDKAYKTLAFSDNIKVTVSFITEQDGKVTKSKSLSSTIIFFVTFYSNRQTIINKTWGRAWETILNYYNW